MTVDGSHSLADMAPVRRRGCSSEGWGRTQVVADEDERSAACSPRRSTEEEDTTREKLIGRGLIVAPFKDRRYC